MAYATPEQLAAALRIPVTVSNTERLQSCLDAAAGEIDSFLDRVTPLPTPAPARVVEVNIDRAVEYWKAPDAAIGSVGFTDTGQVMTPSNGFGKHASVLQPGLKEQWGLA